MRGFNVPIPQRVARFNRQVTNPAMRLVSGRIAPLATVHHVGRRSGQHYRTPVMVFRSGRRWVIALTYGTEVDWLANVLAAGSFDLDYRGRIGSSVRSRCPGTDASPRISPGW